MKYEFNDLLSEEEVTALTAETFSAGKRRRTWRKVVALAACAALVVSIANFGAIAAGVERMFRYIAGVGAVEVGVDIVVQSVGEVSLTRGDRTYLIEGAYAKNGVFYLPLDVVSKGEELLKNGLPAWLDLRGWLYRDGVRLESGTLWDGPAFPGIQDRGEELRDGYWVPRYAEWHYFNRQFDTLYNYQEARWKSEGYRMGAKDVARFRIPEGMDPAGTYEVRFYDTTTGETWTLPLTLANPANTAAHTETRRVGEALVTAVVAENGRGVSLFVELDEARRALGERLIQVDVGQWGEFEYSVYFLDGAGNRCHGEIRHMDDGYFLSPEVVLVDEAFGPVTAVEIVRIGYNIHTGKVDPETNWKQRWVDYEDLDWVIPIA